MSNPRINKLPEFDILMQMAQEQPEELEKLRASMAKRLIESAPERLQHRLRGIQFQIDSQRKLSKNPMTSCLTISSMMQESFENLRAVLNGEAEAIEEGIKNHQLKIHGESINNVIKFPNH